MAERKKPRKLACVIGIGNYDHLPTLKNPQNDAKALWSVLTNIGFIGQEPILNETDILIKHKLIDFEYSIEPNDVVLFYFSGHGAQWESQNYLMPKNFPRTDDMKPDEKGIVLRNNAINAQNLLDTFANRQPYVTIFLLDCCRKDILRNFVLTKRDPSAKDSKPVGLASMHKAGSLIAFACAPGALVDDIPDKPNSLFTKHLLAHIVKPNENIVNVLIDVTNGVMEESNSQQVPFLGVQLRHKNIFLCEQTNASNTPKPNDGLIICPAQFHTNTSNEDINILLLGYTGVGRSTFINALANYFVSNTFEEASKNDMQVLIPTCFTYFDDQTFEEHTIKLSAPDDYEGLNVTRESLTNKCLSFTFLIGNRRLRIINTPPVGDTAGFEQDNLNWQNIITFTSQYSHLNAICVLLKPHEERLTILLRYCLQETLRWFPKAAMQNVMFIFTNARSTDYREGSTSKVLRVLFNELNQKYSINIPFSRHNSFLLDNEGFRYLAVRKNGFRFNEEETLNYSRSWDHTVKEYLRLFTYISRLPLYDIRHTIALHETQQSVHILNILRNKPEPSTPPKKQSNQNKDEQTQIKTVCRKLCKYLQTNSIIPFNDVLLNYINFFVKEERMKQRPDAQNTEIVDRLEKLHLIYQNEFEFINRTIQDDMNSTQKIELIKAEEITALVSNLFSLPIHGSDIRKQFEELRASARMNQRRDIAVNLPAKANDSRMMQELKRMLSTS